MLTTEKSNSISIYDKVILSLLVVSTFLFPKIIIDPLLPAFRIEDILLIPVAIRLWQLKPKMNAHIKLIAAFGAYILFVMSINNRLGYIRDYFEIFKLLKLAALILFLSIPQYTQFIKKLFLPVFLVLIVFNVFQYFNLFNFNATIETFYSPEHHLKYFGLNSDFTKGTKRLLGTMGNPNNNGILFLFFIVLFAPLKKEIDVWRYLLYIVAVFICIHTQSRTAFLILCLGFIAHAFYFRYITKKFTAILLVFLAVLFADFYSDNLMYLWSLKGTKVMVADDMEFQTNNHSLQTRFEIWQHLYGMIKQKPLFGHAPYKEYFYDNHLYSENEYILMTWRYGIVGVIFFVIMIFYPVYKAYLEKNIEDNIRLFAFVFCIMVTALTNNPLSEPRILVMYAIMIGMYYGKTTAQELTAKQ